MTEARCLLSLPPGIGPRLLDVAWGGSGRLNLFIEHLQGKTLDAAASEIAPGQVPRLAQELCERLSHLHRAGWIHADLKPENVLLTGEEEGFDVRLLDFGFAINRFGLLEPKRYGGTPPFMAPELERGWIADERADLYSLGAVLRRIFPDLTRDARWAPILDRLGARIPGERFPDARTAGDAISKAFGLEMTASHLPRFGSGPMVGRDSSIRLILETIRSRHRVRLLIQGRPGTGISRFLSEAVVAIASTNGPPIRIVDLTGMPTGEVLDRALDYLRDLSGHDGAIICGIDDPSPGLRWLDGRFRDRLLAVVSRSRWERIDLPPLDVGSYQEIVSASLGRAGAESDRLGVFLHTATEGDLRQVPSAFLHAVRASGQEKEPGWGLDPVRLEEACSTCSIPAESALRGVAPQLVDPLAVCARAGVSFPESGIQALLVQFADSEVLTTLLDHGYLRRDGPERLSFVTRRLWGEAIRAGHERKQEIDAWVNDHLAPDPDRIDEVLRLAPLAREMGDKAKETAILSEALARAHSQRRWSDVVRVLSYLGIPAASWTSESARAQITELRKVLGPEWSEERLLVVAGSSLKSVGVGVWMHLLERAANGPDVHAAVDALILLAGLAANQRSGGAYERYREMLRVRDRIPLAVPPGVPDFLDARHAMAGGQQEEALRFAEIAATMLRGSGSLYEVLNLQLLAILRSEDKPAEAAAALREALDAATDPEMRAQIRYNLALLYGRIGKFEAAVECADAGIHDLERKVSPARLVGLRTQRAWSWADLDGVQKAQSEASALLNTTTVRLSLQRLAPARLLLGYCHLHRGSGAEAISEIARAWNETRSVAPSELQADCLRVLIDALLDLEGWDFVRDHEGAFDLAIAGRGGAVTTTNARTRALLLHAAGKTEEAVAILDEQLDASRTLRDRLASARYLHHLGLAHMTRCGGGPDPAAATHAAELFNEEIDVLVTPGHAYYRGRALLALSVALWFAGDVKGSLRTVGKAITLARSIKSRRLLVDCLEKRAIFQGEA